MVNFAKLLHLERERISVRLFRIGFRVFSFFLDVPSFIRIGRNGIRRVFLGKIFRVDALDDGKPDGFEFDDEENDVEDDGLDAKEEERPADGDEVVVVHRPAIDGVVETCFLDVSKRDGNERFAEAIGREEAEDEADVANVELIENETEDDEDEAGEETEQHREGLGGRVRLEEETQAVTAANRGEGVEDEEDEHDTDRTGFVIFLVAENDEDEKGEKFSEEEGANIEDGVGEPEGAEVDAGETLHQFCADFPFSDNEGDEGGGNETKRERNEERADEQGNHVEVRLLAVGEGKRFVAEVDAHVRESVGRCDALDLPVDPRCESKTGGEGR